MLAVWFNGNTFALIDAADAPAWLRFDILERCGLAGYAGRPSIARWVLQSRSSPSIVQAQIPDFEQKYLNYLKDKNAYAAARFGLI